MMSLCIRKKTIREMHMMISDTVLNLNGYNRTIDLIIILDPGDNAHS